MANKRQRNYKESALFRKNKEENSLVLDPVVQNLFKLVNLMLSNMKGKTKKYAGVCFLEIFFCILF